MKTAYFFMAQMISLGLMILGGLIFVYTWYLQQ